jgi:uncharacterized protein YndB with AHSA1/START domain
MPGTVRFHRVLRAAPAVVYKAFTNADALVRWLAPNGFTAQMHSFEATVSGGYHMSFTNFRSGNSHSFRARFVELVPGERVCHLDTFDDTNLPGEMRTTVSLKAVSVGTELSIVQEGIPDVIPPEACYLGWQESLAALALLVEADIPG